MFGFGKKVNARREGAREYEGAQADGMNCRHTPRLNKLLAGKLTKDGYNDGTKIRPENGHDTRTK